MTDNDILDLLNQTKLENEQYQQDIQTIIQAIYKVLQSLGLIQILNSDTEVNIGRLIPQIMGKLASGELSQNVAHLKALLPLYDKYKHLIPSDGKEITTGEIAAN